MNDTDKARNILLSEGYTCVLCRGDRVYTSASRGVRPLVAWFEGPESFEGFSAADKVVGRATAFLYVLLGVRSVYACVISSPALQVLNDYHIAVEYGELAEYIVNRSGDGMCPFEAAVLDIEDPARAYSAIKRKMSEMNISV